MLSRSVCVISFPNFTTCVCPVAKPPSPLSEEGIAPITLCMFCWQHYPLMKNGLYFDFFYALLCASGKKKATKV